MPQESGADNEGVGSGLLLSKEKPGCSMKFGRSSGKLGRSRPRRGRKASRRSTRPNATSEPKSELYWRLMMEGRYDLEFKIVDLYETRADPAAIDLINEVIAIIRRNGEPRDARFREIWRLMQKSGAPNSPRN